LETFIFPEGRIIIKQGDEADAAYMIESGEVRVFINKEGKETELATLGVDQIFGETALFSGSHYGASVQALSETTLVKITPDILDIKIRLCDPMLRALIQMMMERQRKSNDEIAALKE